jgi:signal peptidase I
MALRRTLRVLWVGVIPVLLAGLALRYLVPPAVMGGRGVVIILGRRFGLYFFASLFLLFSALARYWFHLLPGVGDDGRDAVLSSAPGGLARARKAIVFVVTLAAAVGVVLVLRARVAEPYAVQGTSMLPTLEAEDRILGNKVAYLPSYQIPRRGDVVVFRSAAVDFGQETSGLPEVLVKRVVGLPGDRIDMKGNAPVINGWAVPTCEAGLYVYLPPDGSGHALRGQLRVEFIEDRTYLTVSTPTPVSFRGGYVVQPGEVFVLGDNRGRSLDSRALHGGHGGGVPIDAIQARAQWFLAGTHRSGDVDMGRLLHSIEALQTQVRLEGLDTQALEEGVLRCLRDPPKNTRPPSPEQRSASRDRGT